MKNDEVKMIEDIVKDMLELAFKRWKDAEKTYGRDLPTEYAKGYFIALANLADVLDIRR